jgi:hypothetical protein
MNFGVTSGQLSIVPNLVLIGKEIFSQQTPEVDLSHVKLASSKQHSMALYRAALFY